MRILILSVLALNDYASSTVGTSSVLQEKRKGSRSRKDEWKYYVFLPALITITNPFTSIHILAGTRTAIPSKTQKGKW